MAHVAASEVGQGCSWAAVPWLHVSHRALLSELHMQHIAGWPPEQPHSTPSNGPTIRRLLATALVPLLVSIHLQVHLQKDLPTISKLITKATTCPVPHFEGPAA